MKIVIPGGSGHIGTYLVQHFQEQKQDVQVLSRSKKKPFVYWDGHTLGEWQSLIDGSDVVINLAGRLVNCWPTQKNLKERMDSRINSTRAIGIAISRSKKTPKLWIQMSTAGIYDHSFGPAHDEDSDRIGKNLDQYPYVWQQSTKLAINWEKTLFSFKTPLTRKVAVRMAFFISPIKKGYFDVLRTMVKRGMGGPIAGGQQYISWIHYIDFIRVIEFIMSNEAISGVLNVGSPNPITQKEFMSQFRKACDVSFYFPITKGMSELGAIFMKTDTELVLKSRRMIPKKLLSHNFQFQYPDWPSTLEDILNNRS